MKTISFFFTSSRSSNNVRRREFKDLENSCDDMLSVFNSNTFHFYQNYNCSTRFAFRCSHSGCASPAKTFQIKLNQNKYQSNNSESKKIGNLFEFMLYEYIRNTATKFVNVSACFAMKLWGLNMCYVHKWQICMNAQMHLTKQTIAIIDFDEVWPSFKTFHCLLLSLVSHESWVMSNVPFSSSYAIQNSRSVQSKIHE